MKSSISPTRLAGTVRPRRARHSLSERKVEPEILDSLPENHPAALANRRDIRRINFLMGNYRWFARALHSLPVSDERIIELGAGAGDLGLYLQRKHAVPPTGVTGLDLCSRPGRWPVPWKWLREDLEKFSGLQDYPVVLANLLLHQFSDSVLRDIGARLSGSARVILCVEPARRRLHQAQLKLLVPFGLHPVSRHDGRVSIAAGFIGNELPDLLGLDAHRWSIQISTTFLGAYRMRAIRRT